MEKVTGILSRQSILKDYQPQPIVTKFPGLQVGGGQMINISSEHSMM